MRWFYEVTYRHFRAPWDVGPRQELVELVTEGALTPCRAIDLGCGTGANAIFLAQHGFEVTGVDFATAGIEKATRAAADAGARVDFVVDDLTDLRRTRGPFDFLLGLRVSHPLVGTAAPLLRPPVRRRRDRHAVQR